MALLVIAALYLVMFIPVWVGRSMKLPNLLLTALLLIVPLLATGVALLREGPQPEEGEAPGDTAV